MDPLKLIRSIERTQAASIPSLKNCLIIDSLAAGSLAQAAGLAQGDLVLSIQGQPASQVDRWQALIEQVSVSYLVYRPAVHTLIHLATAPAPLGVKLVKSSETVLADYRRDPGGADHKDLYPIWNRMDADSLKKICLEAISPLKMGVLHLLNRLPYSPEYLFYGAALYDVGVRKAGMKAIMAFGFSHTRAHTQEQSAVVSYYYARELLDQGHRERAAEVMREAFSQWHHPRIQKDLHSLTGEQHEFHRHWPGRQLELEYTLTQVEFGSGLVNLGTTLSGMREDQFLLICVLGGYRVNRFYNAFMQRYLAYKKCFTDRIHDLHIVTSNPEQENHPDYFVHEEQVVTRLGPIKLLSDPAWLLVKYFEPHGSPTIYAVNNKRRILYEGDLDEVDMWALIKGLESSGGPDAGRIPPEPSLIR